MEMEMSKCRKEAEDEQQQRSRKGKRNEVDLFVFLPDDIVSDILKRLPDAFLEYKAKHVCRRWLDLISNRILLDRASFILQNVWTFRARHVDIREEGEEGLQVKVQNLEIPLIGKIRSWGNEFLLISDYKETKRSLYVYNLLTKEGSYLPECNASCGGYCTDTCGVALSFDRFKGIYKVVHLFTEPPIECHILILTKDIVSSKWKKIQVPNCMNDKWLFSYKPVSVQGRYVHWVVNREVRWDKRLISMDMVKEEIVDMTPPIPLDHIDYTIFEMGGSLALFDEVSQEKAELWILKDFQRNKWDKLQSVTLEHRRLSVCGAITNNKYIIFKCLYGRGMWYYDLKNGALTKLDIHIGFFESCMVHSSPPSFK